MKKSRIFRGDFREHADGEFVASRQFVVNGETVEAGSTFDKDSVSARTLRLLYENRKLNAADSLSSPQEGTVERDTGVDSTPDVSDVETPVSGQRRAIIVEKGAGWFAVEDSDGNKIGKSTRDEDEAKGIKTRFEAGEDFPD